MGWFTRSSDSQQGEAKTVPGSVPEPQQEQEKQQQQQQASHSSRDLPSSEPFSPIPIPDDQPKAAVGGAEMSTAGGGTGAGAAGMTVEQRTQQDFYLFDEYKPSEDVMDKYKVGDAMNHLFACSSLGSNIRNYYRFGTFRDCRDKYEHLKFCMALKTKTDQVAQIMIQKREAELRAAKAALPNSEDVWTVRSSPPEDLVDLAQHSP